MNAFLKYLLIFLAFFLIASQIQAAKDSAEEEPSFDPTGGVLQKGEQDIKDTKKDFEWVDYDKNGFIDAQELRNSTPSMEEDDITDYFETFDSDRDGVLSFEEFLASAKEFKNWGKDYEYETEEDAPLDMENYENEFEDADA